VIVVRQQHALTKVAGIVDAQRERAGAKAMTSITTLLRIVLSDSALAAAAQVLAFHGGAVLYRDAWTRLRDECDRRRDGLQAQPIWMPRDVLNSLPSAVEMLLRQNIAEELSVAA
jgi:hypothetical protein